MARERSGSCVAASRRHAAQVGELDDCAAVRHLAACASVWSAPTWVPGRRHHQRRELAARVGERRAPADRRVPSRRRHRAREAEDLCTGEIGFARSSSSAMPGPSRLGLRRSGIDEKVTSTPPGAGASATSATAGLRPPTSKSQQMPPKTRSCSTCFCIGIATGRSGRRGFQHEAAHADGVGLAHRLFRVDGPFPVRVRPVVTMHVDGAPDELGGRCRHAVGLSAECARGAATAAAARAGRRARDRARCASMPTDRAARRG